MNCHGHGIDGHPERPHIDCLGLCRLPVEDVQGSILTEAGLDNIEIHKKGLKVTST